MVFHIVVVFTDGQYLIAAGEVSGASNTINNITYVIELIKTNSTPSFGQLPSPLSNAVGTMLGNTPILCGGSNGYSLFDKCISYHQDSEWTQSHSMVEARGDAAGVKVNTTNFWILGGYHSSKPFFPSYWNSTEFIIQGQTKGVPGPKLPYGMCGMCAVMLENDVFVIGGSIGDNVVTNEVWIYDTQNGFAKTQGPSLTVARRFHACSTMTDGTKTFIITAGGWNDTPLVSVEIYDPTENTWHSGTNKFQSTKILILI